METRSPSLSTLSSPEYLQGAPSVEPPTTRFAVAVPQALTACLSQATGSVLTSLPGKVAVSSLSGLGWATFGTLHSLMWATRFIFTGAKTERAVHEVASAVDIIGRNELAVKESLRNGAFGSIHTIASYVPGGSLVQGSLSAIGTLDATAKATERWGLFGLRALVTNLFSFTKYVVGGEWFRLSERKVEHIKKSLYNKMIHPSPLGEKLLLWGNEHHSAALKMIAPTRMRPAVTLCSEKSFLHFLTLTAQAKRIILEKVISSRSWIFSLEESRAFEFVLERWIKKEKEGAEQSVEDKKVLRNLYSIYQTLSSLKPILQNATPEEIESFFSLPLQEKQNLLFSLLYIGEDAESFSQVLPILSKKLENLNPEEKAFFLKLLGQYTPMVREILEEITTPSEFLQLSPRLQYRICKIVRQECKLTPKEQTLFFSKMPNITSWLTASIADKELLGCTALFHFNRLPKEHQKKIYNISFGEVKKLSPEILASFLYEVFQHLPFASIVEKISIGFSELINPDEAAKREEDIEFLENCFYKGVEALVTDTPLLRKFIQAANRRLAFEKKILLRDSLEVPLNVYYFSEETLQVTIKKYKAELQKTDLSEEERVAVTKLLKILRKALEWHIAELSDKEASLDVYELKEGEHLPPRRADLPETPLAAINEKIGPGVVTSGSFFRTFDIMGSVFEKTLEYGSLTLSQVPRALGNALDTTAGSTAVYGSIRALALALQVCAQFQSLMNHLARSLKVSVQGKEYTWIDSVERPAAAIPLIPLKLAVPLQDTLLGGIESIKARFDSWNEKIVALGESEKKIAQIGSPEALAHAIEITGQNITTGTARVRKIALASSDQRLSDIASTSDEKLKEIFTSSKDMQEASIRIRNAAISEAQSSFLRTESGETRLFEPLSPGVDQNMFVTQTATASDGMKVNQRNEPGSSFFSLLLGKGQKSKEDLYQGVSQNPVLNVLTKDLFSRSSHLTTLYQNLQIAQSAQKTISEASFIQKIFTEYGGEKLSSLYASAIAPSLGYGLALWKKEAECASAVVSTLSAIESLETKAAYTLFSGIERTGDATQGATETAVRWLSEHVGDMLLSQQSEGEKKSARHKFDTALSFVAGLGSRSLVTLFLGSFFGFYSPVIVLPFLLSKTIPDLLNASAEPISRNLGKSIVKYGYHGLAWAGKRGGFYSHEGMTAIGKFVQAALNRHQGYIDEQRIRAFISLEVAEQQYVFELIKESTQIDEAMKKELIDIGNLYFPDFQALDQGRRGAFVEALLLAYDHLQPQDYLKITPAYFHHLDKRVQRRIKQVVKQNYPSQPFHNHEDIVAAFNALPKNARKSINKVTREEFLALSPEQKYEFCFQVLQSSAYKNWYLSKAYDEPAFNSLWEQINPQHPTMQGETLDVLLELYQDVGDGELANISPQKLFDASISRLLSLYKLFDTYHPEDLSVIADAADVERDAIESILQKENPSDPSLYEKRNSLIAAFSLSFRQLPEYAQKKFFDLSPYEVEHMTREEKKIYLEFLLQKCPDQKKELSLFLSCIDLKEKKDVKEFVELFNLLQDEDKISIRQAAAAHKQTLSFLTKSLIEELKGIDTRLKRSSLEKKEAEQGMVEYNALLDAIQEAGGSPEGKRRIEAIAQQLHKAAQMKLLKEQEISSLLLVRKEIEKMLLEEHMTIPPNPIQEVLLANPLLETICDLLMSSLKKKILSSSTPSELEESYFSSKSELASMIERLSSDKTLDSQGKEFLSQLKLQADSIDAAFEEQKERLRGNSCILPPHLEIIVRGTKDRFAEIKDVSALQRSLSETTALLRELAKLLPQKSSYFSDVARREIESLHSSRQKELQHGHSHWNTVRTLLPLLSAGRK